MNKFKVGQEVYVNGTGVDQYGNQLCFYENKFTIIGIDGDAIQIEKINVLPLCTNDSYFRFHYKQCELVNSQERKEFKTDEIVPLNVIYEMVRNKFGLNKPPEKKMKFKIKDVPAKNDDEIEFWLEVNECGELILKFEKGNVIGIVLWIDSEDLVLHRAYPVDLFGFACNKYGQIKLGKV